LLKYRLPPIQGSNAIATGLVIGILTAGQRSREVSRQQHAFPEVSPKTNKKYKKLARKDRGKGLFRFRSENWRIAWTNPPYELPKARPCGRRSRRRDGMSSPPHHLKPSRSRSASLPKATFPISRIAAQVPSPANITSVKKSIQRNCYYRQRAVRNVQAKVINPGPLKIFCKIILLKPIPKIPILDTHMHPFDRRSFHHPR